jgi:hypothetical protein
MYCPNCGKENPTQTKFCRSCGLGLDKIVQSLSEQMGETHQEMELQKKKHQVERWLTILLGTTGTIFVGFVLWGIIYKLIIVKGAGLEGFALLAIILGMVSALVLVLYKQYLINQAAKLAKQSPQLQNPVKPKSLQEPSFQPIGSVTEHTTELLVTESKGDTKEI